MTDMTGKQVKPKVVLRGATEACLSEVVVVGRYEHGGLYVASSGPEIKEILALLKAGSERVRRG